MDTEGLKGFESNLNIYFKDEKIPFEIKVRKGWGLYFHTVHITIYSNGINRGLTFPWTNMDFTDVTEKLKNAKNQILEQLFIPT